ncbi:hypothetical protein [Bradyrhizobium sp. 5.13L]
MASAEAFTLLKLAGAVCLISVCLIWLGFRTWNADRRPNRSGASRCRRGISARHYCRSAESEVVSILSRLHPAIYRPNRRLSPGSLSSLGSFQLRSILLPMWS